VVQSAIALAKQSINNANIKALDYVAPSNNMAIKTSHSDAVRHANKESAPTMATMALDSVTVIRVNTATTASVSVAGCRVNMVTMASDSIAVRRVNMATVALYSVVLCPAIEVHPKMVVAVLSTKAMIVSAVCSPKPTVVSSAKANTKVGPAVNEWISVNPSDVPTKFVIVAPPLCACTCQDRYVGQCCIQS
jgi:hypothetical protein